jgi:hypothetical protein
MTGIVQSVLTALLNKNHHKEGISGYEPFVTQIELEEEFQYSWREEELRSKIREYKFTITGVAPQPIVIYTTTKGKIKMTLPITQSQQVTLTVSAVNDLNQPVALPGAVTWTSNDTTSAIATLTASADGTTAAVVTTGGTGDFLVTAVSGSFTATFDISVTADAVSGLVITAGAVTSRLAPVAAPAPAPAAAPVAA